MEALGVHHVSINVSDVDQGIAFYTGTLGFALRTDRPDFGFPGAWLDVGGQQVHLIEAAPPANLGQHFAIQVADIEATVTQLREQGVAVSDVFAVATSKQAFLSDPFGNSLELHEVGVAQ
jgi:glyoxylase I family protein